MFEHRISTKTKNMAFWWQSPHKLSWQILTGTVPEILLGIKAVPGLMVDYHWLYCGVRIEAFSLGGVMYEGPAAVHDAMQKLGTAGGMGFFKMLPTRRGVSSVARKSFTLHPDNAKWLNQFENQSAEIDRLITQEREKHESA